ncbi:MAG: hypothetical protein LC795_14580 [Acidobacteria bacterium]|nr:hypothetical protein [Acidobacteriota bacterium]
MTRRTFWTYTVIIAICGLSSAAALGWRSHSQPPQQPRVSAHWKEHFQGLGQMVAASDAVVLARADSVAPGRVAFSSNNEDSLAFEVVNFTVVRGMKGERTGGTVSVERVSSSQDGTVAYFNFDGGDFEVGGTYLLFLKRQEDGGPYYYQVNDQGRFHEEGGRLVAASPGDPVAGALHGRSTADALKMLR